MAIDLKNYEPALMAGADVSVNVDVSVADDLTVADTLTVTGTSLLTGAVTATAGVTSPASLTGNNAGANTAGGNTTAGFLMGASGIGIYFGDGAPTISAVKGSLYLNFTGSSTSTRLYVNNGTTNWVAVTTAS